MELLIVLLVCGIIAIPVMAIVALVRTGKLRDSFEESLTEQMDRIRDLEGQLSTLRRDFAQVQRLGIAQTETAPGPKPAVANKPETVSTPEPAPPVTATAAHVVPPPVAAYQPPAPAQALESLTKAEEREPLPPAPAPTWAQLGPPAPVVTHLDTPPQPRSVPPPIAPSFAFAASQPPRPEENRPPRKTIAERLRSTLPLEEVLGLNLFAKIGIVLLVLGFALLGRVALISMGPAARVVLIYAVSGILLGGGIWLERKERYRLVGRTGIGGGWALLFFTTYALHHVAPMAVLQSNTADCVLMLIVAIAMVAHTLRYKSQLVTGLAFLLAFSTVATSQDTVYSLAAGVILALGIVVIALRMGWFELEIFGIIASYANHFYWLYKLYPEGMAGHAFPQFWSSSIILILYWAVFRVSYIARRIQGLRDERLATIAALLNPVLLLATMKFQSTRPELAFYALLGLGALEFFFGQLPVTRRRRPAFILLSVLGSILIFAAVPFKYSGNNIALLWMIAAEVLLVAGIAQKEVVFRRLGLIGGLFTGLLVIFEASAIFVLRQVSQAPMIRDGVLLLACSALFYVNAHALRTRWKDLFTNLEDVLGVGQSYLGAVTAFLGAWSIFTGDWTAISWAAVMLALAWGKRSLDDNHLLVQTLAFAAAILLAVYGGNLHLDSTYPHHLAGRLITLPILGSAFYWMYWILRDGEGLQVLVRRMALWSGSAMLALLAFTEVNPIWVALIWVAFAAIISLVGRRWKISDLCYQEHVLATMGAALLSVYNLDAHTPAGHYVPFIGCAAVFYAISRFCTLRDATYARHAAWVHTCAGTACLAALACQESPQPWLAAVWAVFALALAITDRLFDVEELPWQAHILAAMAVARAVTFNFYDQDKWHGIDLRLITVSILIAVLYTLARWVRMPVSSQSADARHCYTWIASALSAWMLWSELQPISVAVGLAILGLLLFEIGHWRDIKQLRLQGYAGLIAAFVRIFFVNLTAAAAPGEALSPRIYTVAPIALVFFFVWAQQKSTSGSGTTARLSVADLIAYPGTISVAALFYFQLPGEWIVFAWAITVAVLLAASLLLRQEVFLHQGELLTAGIVARGLAHNIFSSSYFVRGGWRGSIGVLSLTSALLLLCLPIAFRLKSRYSNEVQENRLVRALALRRPEQILFFAPVLLVSLRIAIKLDPGMVTLSWGIEGVMVIILGLIASERSYRLTGLFLLLLCVGKIVVRDAWHLAERDRYITFIALGAALTLVSTLYGKYRETVRKLL